MLFALSPIVGPVGSISLIVIGLTLVVAGQRRTFGRNPGAIVQGPTKNQTESIGGSCKKSDTVPAVAGAREHNPIAHRAPVNAQLDPGEPDFVPATGNPESHDYLDYYRHLKRARQLGPKPTENT